MLIDRVTRVLVRHADGLRLTMIVLFSVFVSVASYNLAGVRQAQHQITQVQAESTAATGTLLCIQERAFQSRLDGVNAITTPLTLADANLEDVLRDGLKDLRAARATLGVLCTPPMETP